MMPYPKFKRIEDLKYQEYLRSQPCAICGRIPCEPAHQRLLGGGMGIKPGDDKALPNCFECHRLGEHAVGGGILTVWNERSGLHFTNINDLRDYLEILCHDMYKEFKSIP